jgi:predicted flavoprotein YhiN
MKIAIVGAGAAGLMAAATILETAPHAELFLIEKNNGLGKKVIISGGGRCNVTTGIQDVRTVLTKYPRGGKFLSSAIYTFPPEAVYAWFEDHGVPLKTEEDLRVFPVSNDGHDIVQAFERVFAQHKVHTLARNAGARRAEDGRRVRDSPSWESRAPPRGRPRPHHRRAGLSAHRLNRRWLRLRPERWVIPSPPSLRA